MSDAVFRLAKNLFSSPNCFHKLRNMNQTAQLDLFFYPFIFEMDLENRKIWEIDSRNLFTDGEGKEKLFWKGNQSITFISNSGWAVVKLSEIKVDGEIVI